MTDRSTPSRGEMRALLLGVCDLVDEHLDRILSMRHEIAWKADGSPVTSADVMIEPLVHGYVRARLGEVALIGEESYRAGSDDPPGWRLVLDPIDGTENFCSGLKIWGVSVSLWRGGVHAGSLLYAPELGERLMTGDTIEQVPSRITGLSSTVSAEVIRELTGVREARILGCAVYNLMNVIRGSFTRFVNPAGAYSWDLLAGLQLALEHGLRVEVDAQPYDGEYLEPGRRYRVDIRH